jgi:hypothetical protein
VSAEGRFTTTASSCDTIWLEILPRDSSEGSAGKFLSCVFVGWEPDRREARSASAADRLLAGAAAAALAGGSGALLDCKSDEGSLTGRLAAPAVLLAGRFRLPVLIPDNMMI